MRRLLLGYYFFAFIMNGRADYMAALGLRNVSLNAAERALDARRIRGIDRIGVSVLVPASEAFDVTLEFAV